MVILLSTTILVFHIHRVGLGQELFNDFNLIVIVMHPFMKDSLKKDQANPSILIAVILNWDILKVCKF